MTSVDEKTQYEFDADIAQVMSLIINSLYSNKEIFLRELISNAVDALQKSRHANLIEPLTCQDPLKINISFDKEAKTLTISDNGVGMSKKELINNLGTIAKSGTKQFSKMLEKDENLIGQFGVGFYSAFLVADRVDVLSCVANEAQSYKWSSDAGSSFEVVEGVESLTGVSGTDVVLHLKEDQLEYASEERIKAIVKKHSEFVDFPIMLQVTREKEEAVEEEKEDDLESGDDDDKPVIEEVEDEKEEQKKKTRKVKYQEWVQLNPQPPLWSKKPKDCTSEQYKQLFQCLNSTGGEYFDLQHFHTEGDYSFDGLLYVPKKPPYDLFDKKERNNVKLHVRKVFVTDDCKNLIPDYLSFVIGVVDSRDLPLGVSREILQQSKVVQVINKTLVKKCLTMFDNLSQDTTKYEEFFNSYGKNLKLGIHEDTHNREKLIELLRFSSTHDPKTLTSLKDYVSRMKDDQKAIYYLTGESRSVLEYSPLLEALHKREYEVLFLTEPIDEYIVQHLTKYQERDVKCVSKAGLALQLTPEDEKLRQHDEKYYAETCEAVKTALTGQVADVVLSHRMVDTPCCLVTAEFGWTANMERIMTAQALRNDQMSQFMKSQKTLELNPTHGLVEQLRWLSLQEDNEPFQDLAQLLFDTALLNSGFAHPKPVEFSTRIYKNLPTREKPEPDYSILESVKENQKLESVVENPDDTDEESEDSMPDLESSVEDVE